jgi:hypothetical protein
MTTMRKSAKIRESDPKGSGNKKQGRGRGPRDGSGPNPSCPVKKGKGGKKNG